MPLAAYRCEHALLCQRPDESARRLASILEALFYVVHLAGLATLFCGRRIALSPSARYGQEPKKGNGMTKKVADLLVDVLAEAGTSTNRSATFLVMPLPFFGSWPYLAEGDS